MKILFVNTSESIGGAAIAAGRLLRALRRSGMEVHMLVSNRQTENPAIVSLSRMSWKKKWNFVAERAGIFIRQRLSKRNLWAIDPATHGRDITKSRYFREADVIHLHWVNQGMLSMRCLQKILESGKPVVWTMHDMWPFTGVCHHADDCGNWKTHCGHCRLLRKGKCERDLSYKTFGKKTEIYGKGKIHFVACSKWLENLAKESPLLKNHELTQIPNAIDTKFYVPGDREEARRALNLPLDKPLILFVAAKATDEGKGFAYLADAVRKMSQEVGVVIVGQEAEIAANLLKDNVFPFEYVSNRDKMRTLYQAADLLAMPTLHDNLPNTIVEAVSCGLPCVGFEIGGLPEMIEHEKTGYLVKYRDTDDLKNGLEWTLEHKEKLSHIARERALESYSELAVAAEYKKIYEKIV